VDARRGARARVHVQRHRQALNTGGSASAPRSLRAVLTFTVCAAACGARSGLDAIEVSTSGGQSAGTAGTGASGNDGGPPPACKLPPATEQPTPNTLCFARRGVVGCLHPSGTDTCLADDPSAGCGNPGDFDCQNECQLGEFGFACSLIGPGAFHPAPPAGCRIVSDPTDMVVAFYCCPCRG
jgi:hypothetical protein